MVLRLKSPVMNARPVLEQILKSVMIETKQPTTAAIFLMTSIAYLLNLFLIYLSGIHEGVIDDFDARAKHHRYGISNGLGILV